MTEEDRDRLITETHRDVQWLKEWTIEHKTIHSKYSYFFFATLVGIVIALVK